VKEKILFRGMVVILVVLIVLNIITHGPQKPAHQPEQSVASSTGTPSSTPIPAKELAATINVSGVPWGQSTCYIGAVEGSSRFNINDLLDLGINTYRIFGGMPRWEQQDDSSVYGSPSIAQIKANPNVINWARWDQVMTNPPGGSDYSWAVPPRWQGNARTLFTLLQQAHIRVIISLRNQDDQHHPAWAPNPPRTTADWNEWWEHVFALVYWLNVRNHYDVNDFEVLNEPNIPSQGWAGSESGYITFLRVTHDAIDYVYRTYLPGHTYHIYAPATTATVALSYWPKQVLQADPGSFDSMDIHVYGKSIRSYVEQVHAWMNEEGHGNEPLWLTEWGSYTNQYNQLAFGVDLVKNLIYGSSPGNDYVYGSHIFSLYDFGAAATGLISYTGVHRPAYYAMRMGIRALQGCRPTYESKSSTTDILAITTRNNDNSLNLLVANNTSTWYDINTNLSALLKNGHGTIWQFDSNHMDTVTGISNLINGHTTFTMPANSALLIRFVPNTPREMTE
jgi:hypothetical protein